MILMPLTPAVNYHHQVFYGEVVVWKRISHHNIVPFFGVSEAYAPLSMVSEWMPNGNVRDYVRNNPERSRLQLVCSLETASGFGLMRVQLLDISCGLSFLHSLEIVHGDLKGVCPSFFLRNASVDDNLTTSHHRTIFSLISRVVRDSMTSGSPALPASVVWRLPHLSSKDPNDGWLPSSLTSTMENLVPQRAGQTSLL